MDVMYLFKNKVEDEIKNYNSNSYIIYEYSCFRSS